MGKNVTHGQLIDYISILTDILLAQMLTLREKNFQIITNTLKKLKDKKMTNVNIEIESLKRMDWTFIM